MIVQRVPTVRRVPDAELLDRFGRETARASVVARRQSGVSGELFAKKGCCGGGDAGDLLALARLGELSRPIRAVFATRAKLWQLNAVAFGQHALGFGKGDVLNFN